MNIECLKFKSVNKGLLVGFADFYIPKTGIEIFGCQLFQKEGKRWINMPSREYANDKGEKKYMEYVRFREPSHKEIFTELALKAIDKKCAEMQTASESPQQEVPF